MKFPFCANEGAPVEYNWASTSAAGVETGVHLCYENCRDGALKNLGRNAEPGGTS
jgi:hypothetical protein